MPEHIEIAGGAGPEMTAAIAAVVASIENEERTRSCCPPDRPIHQSQWIRAGQSAKTHRTQGAEEQRAEHTL